MGLGITPRELLTILNEEYQEFCQLDDTTSKKHIMRCVIPSYHLHEHIWNYYKVSDPSKLDNITNSRDAYFQHLILACPSLGIIRDLCDFSKHSVLQRRTVQVKDTKVKNIIDHKEFMKALAGIPTKHFGLVDDEGDAIIFCRKNVFYVDFLDGRPETQVDKELDTVVKFWNHLFASKGL